MVSFYKLASGFASILGSSVVLKEILLIWDVEDELRKLQRTFLIVLDLVNHVESSPLRFSVEGQAWQRWFEDLRKLTYDADDLLEYISLQLSTRCVDANRENKVRAMVLSSAKELKLPHDINKMKNELENLAKEMESLLMIEKMKFDSHKRSPRVGNFNSTGLVVVGDVVGRERDLDCVASLLDKEPKRGHFSVIPLVGMGGIGKTILARLVYDDNKVRENFGMRVWVSVSMDFNVVRITKSIIESITRSACCLSDLNTIQAVLQGLLFGRKFLLVLDDYWSENHDDWEVLCSPFRFGSRGSKVIVTTRSSKVSSIVSSIDAYKLQILSDDDCWKLIKQRAFSRVEANENLESIGKKIAEKCKGLPLAAMTIGSLLHFKSTQEEWCSILKSDLWDLPEYRNVSSSLMLSYLHLPAHLQKCFVYCSIFPKNHEFEVEELVLLWMAEGFILPVKKRRLEGSGSEYVRRLEDLGSEYFTELYLRSFFEQGKNTSNKIIYKMHDLIHEVARLVSTDICFQTNTLDFYPLFGNTCHLSLLHDNVQSIYLKASQKNERLRTFLVMSEKQIGTAEGKIHPELFSSLRFVRSLDLSHIGLEVLPDSIGHLKYARYLNLSGNRFIRLPESMCTLVALQTLKLNSCSRLKELPNKTKNLSNLCHLELDIKSQLQHMPPEFGKLTKLQTLSAFIVGKKNGNGIKELENMNLLRGSLRISGIECVSEDIVESAKLNKKTYLDRLELEWGQSSILPQDLDRVRRLQALVLEKLQPHGNLKELVIQDYCGMNYPDWLSDSNCRITSIQLQGLKYCEILPSLGQLPSLKSLGIGGMPCLKSIDHTFYGNGAVKFPALEFLELHDMTELSSWIDASDSDMPCLTNLTIGNCLKLGNLPQSVERSSVEKNIT